jgi:predicted nucleic acid-binding protein
MNNIVIDTNVLLLALLSNKGASYKLLSMTVNGRVKLGNLFDCKKQFLQPRA